MNPEQVKRREHLGLICLICGILMLLVGLGCLFYLLNLGLALTGFGMAATSTGIFVLNRIPDVVVSPDEAW